MNMNTIQKPGTSRLSKKPKRLQEVEQAAAHGVVTPASLRKRIAWSHLRLRERTLSRRRAKLFHSLYTAAYVAALERTQGGHGVELTDDIIVWNSDGKRVPRKITPVERPA